MANTPKITVNGLELPYWVSVSINSSIDALGDTFTLTYNVHSQTPPGDANPLTFDGDEPAEIRLDGELLLTGYIDNVSTRSSKDGEVVTIAGCSTTADLVKCSILKTRTYLDQTIEAICRDLCKPFGIDVGVDDSATEAASTKLARFKVEFGETVAEALGRAVRYGGLLLFSSPDGALQLSRAGTTLITTVLEHGKNLEQVEVTRDARDRFSDYYVATDGVSGFDPEDTDKDDGRVAHAVDPGVGRHRPIVISTEADVKSQAQRKTQAEWERNRRAGLSMHVSCVWTSWRHAEGLWRANQRVRFVYSKKRIDREMLIESVSLTREAAGSVVQLELAHPDAFDPRKIPLPRKRSARPPYAEFPDAPDEEFFENTPYGQQLDEFGEDYVEPY